MLAAALGVAGGVILVFAPTGTRCTVTQVIGATPSPTVCEQVSMWQTQGAAGWPAPYAFVLAWSLAPLTSAISMGVLPPSAALIVTAATFVISLTSLMSFGAFIFFLPSVVVSGAVVGWMGYAASSRRRMGLILVSSVALASLLLGGVLYLFHSFFFLAPLLGGALFALIALAAARRQP